MSLVLLPKVLWSDPEKSEFGRSESSTRCSIVKLRVAGWSAVESTICDPWPCICSDKPDCEFKKMFRDAVGARLPNCIIWGCCYRYMMCTGSLRAYSVCESTNCSFVSRIALLCAFAWGVASW